MSEIVTTRHGDRVAFDRRGDGPGLVFVAGAGPYRAVDPWTTATAEAAATRGVTTVVFDRLGRGESAATGRLDLERELAAVEALIEVAGGSAVLCGHSSGCSISMAAADRGLPVVGLALWEAPLVQDDLADWADEYLRLLDDGDLLGALEQYMRNMPPEWLEEARKSPDFEQMVAAVVTQRADAESLLWTASAPHAEVFGKIRVPVQAMTGVSTFPGMVAAAESVVAAIPGAVHKPMPGADHAWEPEPMAAELAEFVQVASR